MCTFTYKNPELQIADRDIIVYKNVIDLYPRNILDYIRNGFSWIKPIAFESFTKHFHYKPNKVYTTQLDNFILDGITGKYHSREGFYSYERKTYDSNVKCIIPKGAYYYRAIDNSTALIIYHSNKIKIVGLIDD